MTYIAKQNPSGTAIAAGTVPTAIFSPAGYANFRSIYNGSTAPLYLLFGSIQGGTVSTTNFTTTVGAASTFTFQSPAFAGTVSGIWAAANGSAWTTQY